MIANNAEVLVGCAVREEFDNIIVQHDMKYHSAHEGYAILREEYEEAKAELEKLSKILSVVWEKIKHDEPSIEELEQVNLVAQYLAQEAVQCAAVARKFRWSDLW